MAISGVSLSLYLITLHVLSSVSVWVPVDMQGPFSDGGQACCVPRAQSCLDFPEKCQGSGSERVSRAHFSCPVSFTYWLLYQGLRLLPTTSRTNHTCALAVPNTAFPLHFPYLSNHCGGLTMPPWSLHGTLQPPSIFSSPQLELVLKL